MTVDRAMGFVSRCRGAWSVAVLVLAVVAFARPASATVSLGAWVQHSPDDISGFTTLTGDEATASVTLPFTFTVEGTSFTTLVLSTNGWVEFGTNTSGGADFPNGCLPVANHTNPFLAAYWDDLQTFGTNIRYGTVGTSPNRTFIADYEVDLFSGSEGSDDLRFQIQLHEGSNLINVRYRDQQSATNGISATIGYQGAGGASATTVQPLTCNGKVLDDNRPNEGWSVDVGRAGNVVLFALMAHSPDDISGFTTLSGNDAIAGVTMPFSVTIEGTSYSTVTIGTNGLVQFGTLVGANPTGNTALPSASFTGPTLFYYWDNLQTEGGNIRYGTVGTSPNRTFIVDFQENTVAASGDKVNGQVQIHERSSLINVKYRSTLSAGANGQSATIGFQGAGGAAAVAYPLTFNGKILDDNRPDEGWSVHPRPLGAMSLHTTTAHSPDDIGGFTTLSGDDAIAGVTLPFSITIDSVSYSTVTIGTNGMIQFGTLTGANPTVNSALPSGSFTGPTFFWCWDDLVTEGGNIRYGTVGTSPHRTFIVDFQENRFGDTGSKVNGQVQVHEGSNLISVKYRSTLSPNANGQNATIGFQGAGGAAAYPLTFNGKILDDNLPDAGWSIAPLPICGNSLIETKEACDLGGANGAGTSCCTSVCAFRAAGQTCRASAGVCDVAETCTGSGANCPADGFVSSATVCRSAGGVCDVAENCTGSGPACPADAKVASGTVCRSSAGVCDVAEACDGAANTCPADIFQSSATVCRSAGGVCDVAENCTGSGPACPADAKVASGTVCRSSAGVCDVAEACDGAANTCPADIFQSSATVCRSAGGVCDVAENCTGSGPACPADAKVASGTVCRSSAGVCDVAEACDGAANTCPADIFQSSATVCRSAGGVCDVAENCTGSGPACPADAKVASGTVCRSSAGVCDVAEACDGATDACPADVFQSSATVCRSAAGVCDVAENCTGSGPACPADAKVASGTTCRSSAGVCDVAEACDGATDACPSDAFQPSTTVCRTGSGDLCDLDENCTGSGAACPSDVVAPNTTLCNAGSGDLCDPDENCTGVATQPCPGDTVAPNTTLCRTGSGDLCDPDENCTGTADQPCPADVVAPNTTICNAGSGDLCDPDENCTGTAGQPCPADNVASASTVCRSAAGVCDVAENCTGTADQGCPADSVSGAFVVCRSAAGECDATENCDGAGVNCPTDAKDPLNTPCTADSSICTLDICDGIGDTCTHPAGNGGTLCRAAAGVCDAAENCDGSNPSCPADGKVASGTSCRAAAGVCDVGENCDGVGDNCPPNNFLPSSTVCRSSADVCDVAENCSGSSANCPGDGVAPSSTVCRSAAGVCDVAENCTGSGVNCPADQFLPATTVCRSAVGDCDIAEQCTGSGAACPADAVQPDTDSDSFCDPIDNCPVTPNPGQEDTDFDDDGDACDICTNTLPSFADRSKVVIGKLGTPPGDDTARIKGRCIPFQETPTIDPMTNGVRLVMEDALGNMPIDVFIPGGAYSTATKAGWKVHTFPTGMTAQYKNAGTIVALNNGIKKVKFVIKSGQGITKFNVTGKTGSYPVSPSNLPVKVTFIADPPIAETGQCCEMLFPGPPPAPTCTFVGSGSTLRCR